MPGDLFRTLDGHSVLLYGSDEPQLIDRAGMWLCEHLAREHPVLVAVTPAHYRAIVANLRRAGVDVGVMRRNGLFTSLDAAALMRAVLESEEQVSWTVFDRTFGDLVRKLRARGPLRIYGEIVGLLWANGKCEAALELEKLWNRLRKQVDFELLCSYGIDVHGSEFATGSAAGVVRTHGSVMPLRSGDSSR
ncbi:MAG TPA: MEDS domain-containing protein [Verrucomicrobiae bacterium]|nr:MEDS domain-containing protein [Verrucomicrobiae bacterium]